MTGDARSPVSCRDEISGDNQRRRFKVARLACYRSRQHVHQNVEPHPAFSTDPGAVGALRIFHCHWVCAVWGNTLRSWGCISPVALEALEVVAAPASYRAEAPASDRDKAEIGYGQAPLGRRDNRLVADAQ